MVRCYTERDRLVIGLLKLQMVSNTEANMGLRIGARTGVWGRVPPSAVDQLRFRIIAMLTKPGEAIPSTEGDSKHQFLDPEQYRMARIPMLNTVLNLETRICLGFGASNSTYIVRRLWNSRWTLPSFARNDVAYLSLKGAMPKP